MTTLYQDIKDKLARLHVLEQVIVINVVVFIVTGFFSLIFKGKSYIFDVLALPNNAWEALYCPWTFISYGFLHQGLFHLFFNMLYLYVLSAHGFKNLYSWNTFWRIGFFISCSFNSLFKDLRPIGRCLSWRLGLYYIFMHLYARKVNKGVYV